MANQVKFGLSNVHYALWDDAKSKYSTPVAVKGAVNLSMDPEGDSNTFFADNGPFWTSSTNGGYTGSLEIAASEKQMLVDLLGYELDDNGKLVEFTDSDPKEFALLFEVDGDPKRTRLAMYSVKLSRPSGEHSTTEDTKEPETETFDFTAIAREFDWNGEKRKAVSARCETGDADYDAFMNEVKLPTKASA